MTKQKIEIEIDVPEGCEFDGFIKNVDGVVYQTNEYRQEIILKFKEMKPAKKVIDLSCIVGSGIDCEFNCGGPTIWDVSNLIRIEWDKNPFVNSIGFNFKKCRIRQSPHVHFWGGGDECPLPDGLIINFLWLNDVGTIIKTITENYCSEAFRWGRVVGFEVIGPAEGWRYEWEEE